MWTLLSCLCIYMQAFPTIDAMQEEVAYAASALQFSTNLSYADMLLVCGNW